jgi:plasmid stability protein
MASVTIKRIPKSLLRKVRARAALERRSINSEIVHLLKEALKAKKPPMRMSAEERASAQADAWLHLGSRWHAHCSSKQEIAAIYAARTRGRRVTL